MGRSTRDGCARDDVVAEDRAHDAPADQVPDGDRAADVQRPVVDESRPRQRGAVAAGHEPERPRDGRVTADVPIAGRRVARADPRTLRPGERGADIVARRRERQHDIGAEALREPSSGGGDTHLFGHASADAEPVASRAKAEHDQPSHEPENASNSRADGYGPGGGGGGSAGGGGGGQAAAEARSVAGGGGGTVG